MPSLGEALQETINNLEKIRDSQDPPSDEILDKLDILCGQQIELIDAAIQKNTAEYKNAIKTMSDAAKVTKQAIDDLTKLERSIEKVANAVGKVTELLSKVA